MPCLLSRSESRAFLFLAMSRTASLLFTTAALLGTVGAAAHAGLIAIEVRAEREVARSDGRSRVVFFATLRDDRGAIVPDGTRVRFSIAGNGRLENLTATTVGGVARATVIAPDQPGSTTITANLDSAGVAVPSSATIRFTNDSDALASGAAWVRIEGSRYCGYAVGIAGKSARLVYADGADRGASLRYRSLALKADRLQFDVQGNEILLEGGVRAQRGKLKLGYDLLSINLTTGRGIGFKESGVAASVNLNDFSESLLDNPPPRESFTFVSFNQSRTNAAGEKEDIPPAIMVVASSLSVEPGKQVQFRKASVYLNGEKALKLPVYFMALNQQALFREQLIGAGPGGIAFDFPYYYNVGPKGIGTLHLRRGAQYGSSLYSFRPGWNLDMDHVYNNAANTSQGAVQVLGLTARERGIRWQHAQKLGTRTEASVFADAPSSRSLFATTQVSQGFSGFRVSMLGTGSQQRLSAPSSAQGGTGLSSSSGDLRLQFLAETDSKKLGKSPFQYSFTAERSRQSFFGSSAAASPAATSEQYGVRLFGPQIKAVRGWNLSQMLSVGQATTRQGGRATQNGLSLLATSTLGLGLRVRRKSIGSMSLAYDYTRFPSLIPATPVGGGTGTTTIFESGRQRIRLGTYLESGGATLTLNATQGLDSTQSTLLGDLSVPLRGPWRSHVRLTSTHTAGVGFRDTEFSLGRLVGQNEVALYYSTVAKRFQLDLSGGRL